MLLQPIVDSWKSGRLVPFVGAGLSFGPPALIPHANRMKELMVEGLASDFPIPPNLEPLLSRMGLEAMITIINEYQPGFVADLMQLIHTAKDATWEHRAIVELGARAGLVATVNFDCLLESAQILTGSGFNQVLHTSTQLKNVVLDSGKSYTLLKLHGSCDTMRIDELGVTLQAVGRMVETPGLIAVGEALAPCDLLFVGYRGRDPDVMASLRTGIGKVYWCWHNGNLRNLQAAEKDDNPSATSFLRSRDSMQFECNTTEFLRQLLNAVSVRAPVQSSTVHRTRDTSVERGLRQLCSASSQTKRKAILGRVCQAVGLLNASIELLDQPHLYDQSYDNEERLCSLLDIADAVKEMKRPGAMHSFRRHRGEIDSILQHIGNNERRALYGARFKVVVSCLEQYSGNYDLGLRLALEATDVLSEYSVVLHAPSSAHHIMMQEVALRAQMEAGNAMFFRSELPSDDYTPEILESCAQYIDTLQLALSWHNLRYQALLLENIAQTHNEWVLRQAIDDNTLVTAMRFGITARVISLRLLEFIGIAVARGRFSVNRASELSRTLDWEAAVESALERLRISIRSDDELGIGLALEFLADALAQSQRGLGEGFYTAALAVYEKDIANAGKAQRIHTKLEKGIRYRNVRVQGLYAETPPALSEFMSTATCIAQQISERTYIGMEHYVRT